MSSHTPPFAERTEMFLGIVLNASEYIGRVPLLSGLAACTVNRMSTRAIAMRFGNDEVITTVPVAS